MMRSMSSKTGLPNKYHSSVPILGPHPVSPVILSMLFPFPVPFLFIRSGRVEAGLKFEDVLDP